MDSIEATDSPKHPNSVAITGWRPIVISTIFGALLPWLWFAMASAELGQTAWIGVAMMLGFLAPPFFLINIAVSVLVWGVVWLALRLMRVPRPAAISGMATGAQVTASLMTAISIVAFADFWILPFIAMSIGGALACGSGAYFATRDKNGIGPGPLVLVVFAIFVGIVGMVVMAIDAWEERSLIQEETQQQSKAIRSDLKKCGDKFAVIDGDKWNWVGASTDSLRGCVGVDYRAGGDYQNPQYERVSIYSDRNEGDYDADCDYYICDEKEDYLLVWGKESKFEEARVQMNEDMLVRIRGSELSEKQVQEILGQLRMATPEEREDLIKSVAEDLAEERFS
ncbi:hypothetical protein HNR23_000692 [Nocardiopsis mwathae]|uniref:Uncharacterized protein n=1 Tax=Nocardiopsis mwathae TaxID=1472723 RepID=A0A7W9YEI2_9ACTN|nr:Yip1 family protein [Nocardiopsis mwathae]MBB6170632.1 hypothetical protein [Nocardiopsis mwathae]